MFDDEPREWGYDGLYGRLLLEVDCVLATEDTLDRSTITEVPDQQYPFVLRTGRETARPSHPPYRKALRKLYPKQAFAEIHPTDAKRLGIANGTKVEVESRRHTVVITAYITTNVAANHVFIPSYYKESDWLTFSVVDAASGPVASRGYGRMRQTAASSLAVSVMLALPTKRLDEEAG